MITRFHVKNYKCLRDVDVALKPFNVLIGKNDTGKTSFLEAVRTVAGLVGPGADGWRLDAVDKLAWRGALRPTIEWTIEIAPSARNRLVEPVVYNLAIEPQGPQNKSMAVVKEALSGGEASIRIDPDPVSGQAPRMVASIDGKVAHYFERYEDRSILSASWARDAMRSHRTVAAALGVAAQYSFDPKLLVAPADHGGPSFDPEQEPVLGANGYGLPVVLDYLLGARRSAFNAIERELHEAVPFVKSIIIKPNRLVANGPIGKAISFELSETGYEVAAPLVSDGVMLFLAYLTVVHSSFKPAVMLIEEPENGIHPRQLQRIAEYLKRLTDPSRGANAVQVIVATHSPYFLDFVPADDVLVFGRKQNGETVVAPIATLPGVQQRIESGFSVGEMWFNTGEDRLLQDLLK